MEKAIFLDRDGVIVEDTGFISASKDIRLIKGSAVAIRELNREFKIFLITNQPAVGRGMCSKEEALSVNNKIVRMIEAEGGKIDKTYMCFHHPIHGQGRYKQECECRKPKPGMILEAAREFDIDLNRSFTIGDKTGDIKAGFLAGTKTILVKTGYGGDDGFKDATPDFIAEDLNSAAEIILKEAKK